MSFRSVMTSVPWYSLEPTGDTFSAFFMFQYRLIPSRVQGAFTSCSCPWTTYIRFEEQPPPAQRSDSVQGQALLASSATSPR